MLKFLEIMTNHDIEPVCLQNILNAKLTQMVVCRGVTFKQYAYSKPVVPSYYAVNFLSSGVGKDNAVNCINKYLMSFLEPEMNAEISRYKDEIFQNEIYKAEGKTGKEKRDIEQRANELVNAIDNYKVDISDATFTAIYKQAEQIKRVGYGVIPMRIMEFGDYVESAADGDSNKKETLEKFKDISDGKIEARLVASENRNNYENVPVTGIFCSDYGKLLKEKNNQYFMNFLETGFARRSFIYIPKDFKPINTKVNYAEKEEALMNVHNLEDWLHDVFNAIPQGKCYEFSESAKKMLAEYWGECKDEYNKMYLINPIYANSVNGSHWIITKLSVVYHAIEAPTETLIDSSFVVKAIEFYKKIKPCLKYIVNKRPDTPEDKLKKWLRQQKGPFKTSDIRRERFVSDRYFKNWFDDAMINVCGELSEEGILIDKYNGFGGNAKGWQIL